MQACVTDETPLDDQPSRRHVLLGATAATALGGGVLLGSVPASATRSYMYDLLDRSRAKAGKRKLVRSAAMQDVAQRWANQLVSSGTLKHNPRYASQIPTGWTRAGENVGYTGSGSNPEYALHLLWLGSPGHKANLHGDWTHVGIGRAFDSRRRLWGVQVFARYPR